VLLSGSLVTKAWCIEGGDSLQIWRVAVSTLKQLQAASKEWSSSLVVGCGDHKNPRTWMDKQHKHKKMDMKFGTADVRSIGCGCTITDCVHCTGKLGVGRE
jgi:hypothetical protein